LEIITGKGFNSYGVPDTLVSDIVTISVMEENNPRYSSHEYKKTHDPRRDTCIQNENVAGYFHSNSRDHRSVENKKDENGRAIFNGKFGVTLAC
jgi:hypothetical protein